MSYDFQAVKNTLNISAGQFSQLDTLDGKDDKIGQNIFDMAKEIREKELDKRSAKCNNGNPLYKQICDILKEGFTTWLRPKEGYAETKKSEFNTEDCVNLKTGQPEGYAYDSGIRKFAESLMDQYVKTGSTEGASAVSPNGLEILDYELSFEYNNASNDKTYIKNDRINNDKVADSINCTVYFKMGEVKYYYTTHRDIKFKNQKS